MYWISKTGWQGAINDKLENIIMRHLITGSSGDVGLILYRLYKREGFDILPFDEKVDMEAGRILHLAAKSPPANPEDIIKSNVIYLRRIADYAARNKINELIFFSAVSVYGKQNKENVSENDGIVDPDIYGVSKLLGEKLLRETSLNVLCLRLPAVLGLKNKTNFLSRCYLKLKNNEDIELTNPVRLFNNFISIENIFDFLKHVIFQNDFDVVNLASKKEWTILEIINFMKDNIHSSSRISILNKEDNFFNISTDKAEGKYCFVPYTAKETVSRWIRQKDEHEKDVLLS